MASVKIDNQRRYHGTSAAYVLPKANDIVEQDRLDAQAAAIVEMIGGYPFLAPLRTSDNISKVVDVGCGTGVATIQIATALPSATIYGLDLTPVPESSKNLAPENIIWAQGNALDVNYHQPSNDVMSREIFTPAGLDYIFGRMLFLGINNWPRYFSIASHALKSGAMMEHQDLDWKFYRVGTSECYPELLRKMLGADVVTGEKLEALTKACLHDITSEEGLHQKYTITIARKP
ncbi:hypothetical protein EYC84_002917 [Monilinia fructicola]|uniref:Methyltransferase domain-containing protein n=1 Tax=Monilinia fructicola TaxID=38448 RepID=A0A5M9JSR1_MONFR|nr:hypothetical protein EYC84_002917 [Monilinia fructicola]